MSAIVTGLLSLASFLSVFSFLVWILTLHGTVETLRQEPLFRFALLGVALFGLIPLLIILVHRIKRRYDRNPTWLRVVVLSWSTAGMLMAVYGFGFISGVPFSSIHSVSPQLIVAGSTGSLGIPGMAVVTHTSALVKASLTWGDNGTRSVIVEDKESRVHVFMLRDLVPGTEYWYRLDDGVVHHFLTTDTTVPLCFAAGGDAHFGDGNNRIDLTKDILETIMNRSEGIDFFFSLGDLVQYGFRPEQWNVALKTLAPVTSVVPVAFVPGNHDTLFTGLARCLSTCYPSGIDLESGSRLWYRFDVGKVHFLVLDLERQSDTVSSVQIAWLEQQLTTIARDDWTVVLSHCYFYASGSTRPKVWNDNVNLTTVEGVAALLERYGVDIVLSGHAHHMELLEKSGVTYAVSGSLGGNPDPAPLYVSPSSLWHTTGKFGFLDVTIETERALIVFRDPAGQELKNIVIER
jgi:UDP-2,3-diacylglucosamine pyrophosphatase LpxH